ncbi:MAG: flagellin [Spirochaetales bacterium]|nr:flagellin [Spirochaetales bacterium]
MEKTILIGILFGFIVSGALAGAEAPVDFLNNILIENEGKIDKNMKRLSEGTFLLPDDPANFAIYQKLESHIRGLSKEIENNTDVIYYYQYTESIVGTMIEHLQRIRELLIQRGNAIYSASDRSMIDLEVSAQYDAILFVLRTTEFNRKPVFDSFFKDASAAALFSEEKYFQLINVDKLLSYTIKSRSIYGAKIAQLESRVRDYSIERENSQGMQSTIFDIDYTSEISALRKNELLFVSNILLLAP